MTRHPNDPGSSDAIPVEEALPPDHSILLRWMVMLSAVAGALFGVMAVPSLADITQPIDDAAWETAGVLENGGLVGIAKVFNVLGSGFVVAPVVIFVGLALAWLRRRRQLAVWAIVGISLLFIEPVKALYGRPRPPLGLVETVSSSFPSGHAANAAALALALVLVWVRPGAVRRYLVVVAAAFAVLMALSRIYLRTHWLTDAVAGAALGAGIALAAVIVVDRLVSRTST